MTTKKRLFMFAGLCAGLAPTVAQSQEALPAIDVGVAPFYRRASDLRERPRRRAWPTQREPSRAARHRANAAARRRRAKQLSFDR